VYLILLATGVFILAVYSSVTLRTVSVTVYNPSRDQFEQMHVEYPVTLSCPCTRLSMPYSSFMTIQPHFHQVCSSDFIQDNGWLSYFQFFPLPNTTIPEGIFYALDFREPTGQSLFYLMQTLCQLASEMVTNALVVFNDTQFVSAEPLSDDNFDEQTTILIQQFQQQVRSYFCYIDAFISLLLLDTCLVSLLTVARAFHH
jgi:hypothetical protein